MIINIEPTEFSETFAAPEESQCHLEKEPKLPYRFFNRKEKNTVVSQFLSKGRLSYLKSYLEKLRKIDPNRAFKEQHLLLLLSIRHRCKAAFEYLVNGKLAMSLSGHYLSLIPSVFAELLSLKSFSKKIEEKISSSDKKERDMIINAYAIANIWKLSSPLSLKQGSFKLFGGFSNYFLSLIDQYALNYFQQQIENNPNKTSFFKEVYKAITKMKNNPLTPPATLLENFEKGEIISLQSGWKNHDINLCFLKTPEYNYLVVSNRGAGMLSGLDIYTCSKQVPPSVYKEVFARALTHASDPRNRSYILNEIPKLLKAKILCYAPHQAQKVGNCCWINNMGAVHGIMLLTYFKQRVFLNKSMEEQKSTMLEIQQHYKAFLKQVKEGEKKRFTKLYQHHPSCQKLIQELREKAQYRSFKGSRVKELNMLFPV